MEPHPFKLKKKLSITVLHKNKCSSDTMVYRRGIMDKIRLRKLFHISSDNKSFHVMRQLVTS
jgi:hypothetical protein